MKSKSIQVHTVLYLSYVLNYHYTKFELYWDDYFLGLFVVQFYAAHSERR